MSADPFEDLREPIAPLAPRPPFAADLRRRLAERVGLARPGALVARPDQEDPVPETREYTPSRLHSLTPYLSCRGADRAVAWYQEVFDARLLGEPIVMDDGKVGHAELRVGDTVFMLADEYEAEGVYGPDRLGGTSVSLMLHVPDADATYERALARGATAVRPIDVRYGARMGVLRDPFGHRWMVATHLQPDDTPVEDVPGRRFGDVGT